jgi:hypothetical protein
MKVEAEVVFLIFVTHVSVLNPFQAVPLHASLVVKVGLENFFLASLAP